MEKKYTMQEFKDMFNEAELKALEEIDENLKEEEQETKSNTAMRMALTMQSMLYGAMIRKNLFK